MSALGIILMALCLWFVTVGVTAAKGWTKWVAGLLICYVAMAIFVMGLLFPSPWSEGQVSQGYALEMAAATLLFTGVWIGGALMSVLQLLYRRHRLKN